MAQKIGMGQRSGRGTYNNLSCSGVPGATQSAASRRFARARECFASPRSAPIHPAPFRRSVALSHNKSCTNYEFVFGFTLNVFDLFKYLVSQHARCSTPLPLETFTNLLQFWLRTYASGISNLASHMRVSGHCEFVTISSRMYRYKRGSCNGACAILFLQESVSTSPKHKWECYLVLGLGFRSAVVRGGLEQLGPFFGGEGRAPPGEPARRAAGVVARARRDARAALQQVLRQAQVAAAHRHVQRRPARQPLLFANETSVSFPDLQYYCLYFQKCVQNISNRLYLFTHFYSSISITK